MARLRVLVASAALGVSLLSAAPALAQQGTYPPSAPPVPTAAPAASASAAVVVGSQTQADGSVTFDVCCFTPGETVVVLDANGNVIFTGVADADGHLRGRLRAGVVASLGNSGIASLIAVGQSSGRRSIIQVDVGAAKEERINGSLTRTGSSSTIPLAASGVALTMVGAVMVLIWRRPRSNAPVAV